jgi:hypothetical protein
MAVSAVYTSKVTVTETLSDPYVDSGDNTVKHSGLDKSTTYNGASSVPVTKVATFAQALTAGAATIDLRALVGTNGGAVDGNGLKVQIAKFRAKADNANPITISEGASNGYELLGNGFTLDLKAGQEVTLFLNEAAPDISGSAKTIDLAGTGSQVLECEIVMG